MSRIIFSKGKQKEFLNKVHDEGGLNWPKIAGMCSVSQRTIRAWRDEAFYMKYEAAQLLADTTSIEMSTPNKVLPDFWSTKKAGFIGAKIRYELYGNPGTLEGRRKGGINSQRKFQKNIDFANRRGFKIRKTIKAPRVSADLAEFFGIILGDGGMTDYQVAISFNRQTDNRHAGYIQKLAGKLFNISSSVITAKAYKDMSSTVLISSRGLVDFLMNKGLKTGSKIWNKADIPTWIRNNKKYQQACVKGLMDTDGSFYCYKHKINGKEYHNFAICFTNHSIPLLKSVYDIFKGLNFSPSRSKWRVYLYRKADIAKYIRLIGSNNPKHTNKYKKYIRERYGSGYNRAVLKTA